MIMNRLPYMASYIVNNKWAIKAFQSKYRVAVLTWVYTDIYTACIGSFLPGKPRKTAAILYSTEKYLGEKLNWENLAIL